MFRSHAQFANIACTLYTGLPKSFSHRLIRFPLLRNRKFVAVAERHRFWQQTIAEAALIALHADDAGEHRGDGRRPLERWEIGKHGIKKAFSLACPTKARLLNLFKALFIGIGPM